MLSSNAVFIKYLRIVPNFTDSKFMLKAKFNKILANISGQIKHCSFYVDLKKSPASSIAPPMISKQRIKTKRCTAIILREQFTKF